MQLCLHWKDSSFLILRKFQFINLSSLGSISLMLVANKSPLCDFYMSGVVQTIFFVCYLI